MSYPPGAEVCPIGPLTTLSVHPPHGHFSHWSWAVERYAFGLIQPGEVADPRGHGRQLAEAAAVEWFETSLAQLRMLAAGEQYAASLSNRRARQNAMPWYWWRDRLRPRLAHDLPIRIEIGQTIDGYHWCAGPIQGTACIEANARNFATGAAERLLRIGVEALTWRAAA
jgi:hypothetical protein